MFNDQKLHGEFYPCDQFTYHFLDQLQIYGDARLGCARTNLQFLHNEMFVLSVAQSKVDVLPAKPLQNISYNNKHHLFEMIVGKRKPRTHDHVKL